MAAETLVAVCMAALLVVACGGGGVTPAASFIASAGVGEVLQITMDVGNMVYNYSVINTSYAASGITPGKNSTGFLLGTNPDGSYNVGPTIDNFILGGRLMPMFGGVVAGHLQLGPFGNSNIPVFGISNPIETLLPMVGGIVGTYDYQGFSCSSSGITNVSGVSGCASQYGTISIAPGVSANSAVYSNCVGGDITNPNAHACTTLLHGTIQTTGTLGVYDFLDSGNNHVGWFFAFTSLNGQSVGVIDLGNTTSTPNAYGHMVLTSYASLAPAVADGSYSVYDNEGKESQVTLATTPNAWPLSGPITYTTSYTSTANPGVIGTLNTNNPWPGMNTYYLPASGAIPAASGVAMVTGTGAYTHTSLIDLALFAVGAK